MKDRFYLACYRDNVGGNVAFHAKDKCGYTTDIDKAHIFSRDEAQFQYDNAREYDQPLSADHVDSMAVWKVDFQYLPESTPMLSGGSYAAYKLRKWCGNDVFWKTKSGKTTLDFNKAHEINFDDLEHCQEFGLVLFDKADSIKRRTLSCSKVNKRVMVQGAGLIEPSRLKLSRRRKANPKTRFNCPTCGKINWQHNPYDFEGCSQSSCI